MPAGRGMGMMPPSKYTQLPAMSHFLTFCTILVGGPGFGRPPMPFGGPPGMPGMPPPGFRPPGFPPGVPFPPPPGFGGPPPPGYVVLSFESQV